MLQQYFEKNVCGRYIRPLSWEGWGWAEEFKYFNVKTVCLDST